MIDDEENQSIKGGVGEFKSLATSECEGFSKVGNFMCFFVADCSFWCLHLHNIVLSFKPLRYGGEKEIEHP